MDSASRNVLQQGRGLRPLAMSECTVHATAARVVGRRVMHRAVSAGRHPKDAEFCCTCFWAGVPPRATELAFSYVAGGQYQGRPPGVGAQEGTLRAAKRLAARNVLPPGPGSPPPHTALHGRCAVVVSGLFFWRTTVDSIDQWYEEYQREWKRHRETIRKMRHKLQRLIEENPKQRARAAQLGFWSNVEHDMDE